jgi:hypothetical protein
MSRDDDLLAVNPNTHSFGDLVVSGIEGVVDVKESDEPII